MFEFPIELWAKVFRKLTDRDLVVLCQTCALFHTVAQAQLYETIRLQDEDFRYSRKARETWRFIESFTKNPSLAGLVRTLDFRIVGQPKPEPCDRCPILRELHLFHNLHSITLGAIDIDSNTCSAIQALPNLKSVRLQSCDIDREGTEKPCGTGPSQMLDFDLLSPQSDDVMEDLFPSGFKSFSIGTHSHISNRPGDRIQRILTHVTSAGLVRAVTKLVFKGTIPGSAVQFLETLSQLQHIFLPDPQSEIHFLRSLPSTAIPLLETFSGPADLCDVFLSGRPVHTVEIIVPTDVPHDFLRVLRHSSVDVTDLHLIFDENLHNTAPSMGALLQHAPETIQRFAWNAAPKPMVQEVRERSYPRHWNPVGKVALLSCVPFLARFPSLYTLHGSVIDPLEGIGIPESYEDPEMYEKNIEPAEQQELVRACAEASTSLRLVIFKGEDRDGKWVKWDDGSWEYYAVE